MSTPSVTSDEIERLRKKYPERIPIFLIKGENVTFDIPKTKYLVPSTLTFGEFIYNIRRLCKLKPEKAMFFYIDHSLMNSAELISTIYERHKHKDGTLHLTYSEENTFG
jgi:GABA(A) receptor-associated protein